jgi:hypothetical protein
MRQSEIQFIRGQGVAIDHPDHRLYVALMFQPRMVAAVVALGIVLQSGWLFLALSGLLWLATAFPTLNLFDVAYNRLIAYPRGLPLLGVSPAPRRFAQGMAGTVALAIGAALLSDALVIAWVLEGLFVVASLAVVLGRVCAAANLYLRLAGTTDATPSMARRA